MKKSQYKDAIRTTARAKKWPKNHYAYPLVDSIVAAFSVLRGKKPKSDKKQFKQAEHRERLEMYWADNAGNIPTLREHDRAVAAELRSRASKATA